ncbi:ABC transporter ATP-binding protein [Tumebacillus flagellatus]|uniref:Multidrug ABC transporter ATP-binding protein n=1 Tax=Tumebacillus flagellatus TaxID=1157490 RepID=A0A074LS02_9BACL|nr:ABC transporter ATP-binding protein [Tumebacillus flagellatus]KEO84931.1 multidrug ABC transporter ATP-binding protein [Tumebacillus flagellatus]
MAEAKKRQEPTPTPPFGGAPRPGGPGGPGGFGARGRGPVVKPKNFKGTLKRLWQYFGRERSLLTLIFVLILVDAGITLCAPYLIGRSIDAMSEQGGVDFTLLEMIIGTLLVAYVADAVLTFFQGWLMAGVSQRIVKRLRGALFEKLQKLPVSFFDTRTHGELMSRLSNDIDNVSNTISQATTQLMSGAITIVGTFIMMLVLSPLLTLASVVTIPLVFLLTRTIAKRTAVLFKNNQVHLGKLNGHIEESITGLHVVKAFNHEDKVIEEFEAINQNLKEIGLKAQIWSGFLMPIMNVINNLGFTIVAVVGAVLAVNGMVTVGVIASFLSYSRQFVRPLNDLANIFNVLQSGVAGAERVFEILDEQEEPDDAPNAIELKNPAGRVVFENVSFGYNPDVPILKNVNFDSPAGTSTALVGPTGAGKTTVVNLLTRFYDVTSGAIYLDGRDIREYTRDSLRRCFGIVLQDTYLFSGTIKENIKYGNPDASDAEVEAAAKMANADVFIRRLPKGYETELAENGGNLSQGQRQLLAIARVILAKPSLLILDEATSSIDTRTELHIQEALLQILKGRTSFIIAHRLNTIRDADRIMVVDQGHILEQGSHEELIEQQGRYYNMFYNQFKNIEGS